MIDLNRIKGHFINDKPKYFVFDTETTGLNIMKDKAFRLGVG
ncbi:MAG: hypothetical protein ACRCXT_01695 [Paraclostridium sp.]